MNTLLFYYEPTLLNRDAHKDLVFNASSDFSFAEKVNSVPLTGVEFFEASRDMPVLFSKDEQGDYFPLALLSLLNNAHLQSQQGKWENSYIPAFVRRYPFALTDDGNVCFDADADHFQQQEGSQPLFTEDGENAETLNNAIVFLTQFDAQHQNTLDFVKVLAELDLFKPFNIQVNQPGKEPLRLEGLFAIDEEKLATIDDEIVAQWFRKGWLAWCYAHLHSLGALRKLLKNQWVEDETVPSH